MGKRRRSSPRPRNSGREVRQIFNNFEIGISRAVLQENQTDIPALRMLGQALTNEGRHEEAVLVDRQLVGILPADPVSHYNLACSQARLQKVDDALASLERALQCGYRDLSHLLKDRDLNNVREDPRFRDLVERKWGKRRARRRKP